MNNKPVDRTKKSNIKCEHCKHWNENTGICALTGEDKNYWNRCKRFEWVEHKAYGVKVVSRGNCILCGKKLTEGLFFCKECEAKGKREES